MRLLPENQKLRLRWEHGKSSVNPGGAGDLGPDGWASMCPGANMVFMEPINLILLEAIFPEDVYG